MNHFFSGVGKMLTDNRKRQAESEALSSEAESFNVAGDGGYMVVLKYALFALFAYYNARLFITTVPGWEGYLTAVFALAGEATALYCYNNYKRSTGNHKTALGVFALLLFAFSFTHASISFFKMEHGSMSGPIQFYCERIAFPLLFGLLLLAAIIIPLCHWRTKVAAKQAEAQTKIETDHAELVGETAAMRNKAKLERERLNHFGEEIKLGNEYTDKLKQFAAMKRDELAALEEIPEPFRSQIIKELGLTVPDSTKSAASTPGSSTSSLPEPTQSKPVVTWQGGKVISEQRGN